MTAFLQTQDAGSVQQQQGSTSSESPVCCEGTEQHEEPISGYVTYTAEAPALHPAEQAAPQATPVALQAPFTHNQQQHTAAFAEAKVRFKCCVCFSLDTLFHRV